MDFLQARLATVVLARPGVAWAGGPTVMVDPRSGIRLQVEEACIARPADAGPSQ